MREAATRAWSPEELIPLGSIFSPDDLDVDALDGGDPRDPDVDPAVEAAREAEMLRAAELAEVERRVAEAHRQGYEEGRNEGEIAEAARLRTALEAVEGTLEELRTAGARWEGSIEENVCAVAVAVARHIVGRELRTDPETLADMVRRAVAEFPVDQPIRIRVNPMDLAAITTCTTPAGHPIPIAPDRELSWLADGRIAPGGCVVEGRERIVDGRVDTALERVYRRLTYTHA
jgi:flagellar assembly protein FliH